jgi:hypothetical protein
MCTVCELAIGVMSTLDRRSLDEDPVHLLSQPSHQRRAVVTNLATVSRREELEQLVRYFAGMRSRRILPIRHRS